MRSLQITARGGHHLAASPYSESAQRILFLISRPLVVNDNSMIKKGKEEQEEINNR